MSAEAVPPPVLREQLYREYRIDVLATWKALTWLVLPAAFAITAPWNPAAGFTHWFQRGFLLRISWGFTPLFWAVVAELVATFIYSTAIKWTWDAWDRSVKYPNKAALRDSKERGLR